MAVSVVPYSECWPSQFESEATLLRECLSSWCVGEIEHIGSTSVRGLASKPIVDMLAGVKDLEQARQAIPVLAGLGYEHADHRPHEALWFYKQLGEDYAQRSHQLHLTQVGSALWRERLTFRDALRCDAGLRDEYQALKQTLAVTTSELMDYNQGKRDFISRVLRDNGVALD